MNLFKSGMKKAQLVFLGLGLAVLAGCGGGGSSAPPAAVTYSISGTAATGAALPGAAVTIKDSAGVTRTGITTATGTYDIDVTGLTPPYLVKVVAVGGTPTLYSVGTSAGVINTHPLTDLIIRTWYEVQGTDVETAFNSAIPAAPPSSTQLGVIKQVVRNLVAQFLGLLGSVNPDTFDLISTPFVANSGGFDNFLDHIDVTPGSGVILIDAASSVAPDYQAILAVSGTNMISTLEEDLNNDSTFSVVSTASNSITGITASPYAGVWSLNFTQTVDNPTLCGGFVGDTGTLPFVVDGSGNFTLLETDGRVMISGNITSGGALSAIVYGDSLLNTGTCPAGALTATMTSTSAGAGTFAQGGDEGNLVFTRVTNFAGTWTLSYTITAATDPATCAQAIASIGVPQNGGDTIVDAQGHFTNVTENMSGDITSAGAASFTIPGSTNVGDCDFGGNVGTGTGNYASAYGTFKFNNNKVSGTWSLTRQ
jgi:hypothetical protein